MTDDNSEQLIKIFFKSLLLIALIVVCDRGGGAILESLYFNQQYGERYRSTYVIDSTDADILIFGSSHANYSYDPEIFEEELPHTCYNAGRAGCFTLYNYAVFKMVIGRYKPKLIIFEINPATLEYSLIEYDRLSLLLPYYKEHPELKSIIGLRGPLERVKFISSIYPYNSFIIQIIAGNRKHIKGGDKDYKGYVPHNEVMTHREIDTLIISTGNIDGNKINALKDIISTCKQEEIDLVFVYSPVWRIINDRVYNVQLAELCHMNNVLYLDMSNHPAFINNPEYFCDINHLNNEGASLFSRLIVDSLSQTHFASTESNIYTHHPN